MGSGAVSGKKAPGNYNRPRRVMGAHEFRRGTVGRAKQGVRHTAVVGVLRQFFAAWGDGLWGPVWLRLRWVCEMFGVLVSDV
jgi:hypothetical protein